MITRISIRNFRSIRSSDIDTTWITSFVGANDAGKSNILRALNLFFNGETDPGQGFSPLRDFHQNSEAKRGKARQTEIRVRFRLPETYVRDNFPKEVEWKKVWRENGEMLDMASRRYVGGKEFPSRSKIPALLDRINFTYVPAVKDRAFFNDLQGKVYDTLASVAADPLKKSAESFEAQIQRQLGSLLESVTTTLDYQSSMRLPQSLREIFESLEFSANGIPLSRRGDGIKIRHIPMLLEFIATKQDEILVKGGVRYTHIWGFEEPENNVEMSAAFDMASGLREIVNCAENRQLFLTTHSPVFYKIRDDGDRYNPWIRKFIVKKVGDSSQVVSGGDEQLDREVGLMPLVAPFVEEAKKQYDQLKRDHDKAKEIANRSLPTVFVEGETDRQVLSLARELFFPNTEKEIIFQSGGADYGSANALASRALAWMLEMRHREPVRRSRAVAIFDNDDAGKGARASLNEKKSAIGIHQLNQFKIYLLPTPKQMIHLRQKRFRFAVDLESFYSDETWRIAEKRGWLEPVQVADILSQEMISDLADGKQTPFNNLSDIDACRLKNKFSNSGKEKAVNHIKSLDEAGRRSALAPIETFAIEIFSFLMPELA